MILKFGAFKGCNIKSQNEYCAESHDFPKVYNPEWKNIWEGDLGELGWFIDFEKIKCFLHTFFNEICSNQNYVGKFLAHKKFNSSHPKVKQLIDEISKYDDISKTVPVEIFIGSEYILIDSPDSSLQNAYQEAILHYLSLELASKELYPNKITRGEKSKLVCKKVYRKNGNLLLCVVQKIGGDYYQAIEWFKYDDVAPFLQKENIPDENESIEANFIFPEINGNVYNIEINTRNHKKWSNKIVGGDPKHNLDLDKTCKALISEIGNSRHLVWCIQNIPDFHIGETIHDYLVDYVITFKTECVSKGLIKYELILNTEKIEISRDIEIINNENYIKSVEDEYYSEERDNYDYDRDTFDAMTDGQYGNYEDYFNRDFD